MKEDFSFIKLFKNDFYKAVKSDNPNIVEVDYFPIIQQATNETFFVMSNSKEDISFVGGIKVELVDCCNELVIDITENFYYTNFVDSNGITQIRFEFGNVGVDYYRQKLYLKITDLINNNFWHSNMFCVSDYEKYKTARIDFTHNTKINGFSYDLHQDIQSIRIIDFYENTQVNEENKSSYIDSDGLQTDYRNVISFWDKWNIEKLDKFTNNRLLVLFNHNRVYVNGERVKSKDFKYEERIAGSNFGKATILLQKQGEIYTPQYQLYQELEVIQLEPPHNSVFTPYSALDTQYFIITFNRNVSVIPNSYFKIYKDNVYIGQSLIEVVDNKAFADIQSIYGVGVANTPLVGIYNIVVPNNAIFSGTDFFGGITYENWKHEIKQGVFNSVHFNNIQFLTT